MVSHTVIKTKTESEDQLPTLLNIKPFLVVVQHRAHEGLPRGEDPDQARRRRHLAEHPPVGQAGPVRGQGQQAHHVEPGQGPLRVRDQPGRRGRPRPLVPRRPEVPGLLQGQGGRVLHGHGQGGVLHPAVRGRGRRHGQGQRDRVPRRAHGSHCRLKENCHFNLGHKVKLGLTFSS